jgi:hypothetical protein
MSKGYYAKKLDTHNESVGASPLCLWHPKGGIKWVASLHGFGRIVAQHDEKQTLVMWVKQCHKPRVAGNGNFIPPIKMVMTGGWFMALFYPH